MNGETTKIDDDGPDDFPDVTLDGKDETRPKPTKPVKMSADPYKAGITNCMRSLATNPSEFKTRKAEVNGLKAAASIQKKLDLTKRNNKKTNDKIDTITTQNEQKLNEITSNITTEITQGFSQLALQISQLTQAINHQLPTTENQIMNSTQNSNVETIQPGQQPMRTQEQSLNLHLSQSQQSLIIPPFSQPTPPQQQPQPLDSNIVHGPQPKQSLTATIEAIQTRLNYLEESEVNKDNIIKEMQDKICQLEESQQNLIKNKNKTIENEKNNENENTEIEKQNSRKVKYIKTPKTGDLITNPEERKKMDMSAEKTDEQEKQDPFNWAYVVTKGTRKKTKTKSINITNRKSPTITGRKQKKLRRQQKPRG